MSIRKQLNILVTLQTMDAEIQKIQRLLEGVKDQMNRLDSEMETQESILEHDQHTRDALQKAYRSLESDLSANAPKIAKSKGRLSSVKSNKEYQSLLKEIEDLTLINSELEDQMLTCLEKIDGVEERLKDQQKKNKAFKIEMDQNKDAIMREAEKARRQLEGLQKERQGVLDTVHPDLMTKFMRLRNQVGNITIVRVANAVCEGCNTNIPPQMYNELQRCDELMFCPHCQRMIFTDSNG